MFIVEHPVLALVITLGILIVLKTLFALSNYIEKVLASKKPTAKKEDKPVETKPVSDNTPKESNEKAVPKNNTAKTGGNCDNYLYDRFVVAPTRDDQTRSHDKICNAFLEDKEAVDIKNKKLDIKVEPLDLEQEKSQRVHEILMKYENKDKLLDDFENMPREMKLLILENIIRKM